LKKYEQQILARSYIARGDITGFLQTVNPLGEDG